MIGSNADFARRLRSWFDRSRRDLPWRLPLAADATGKLDPYKVLVSEAMLQQTQVATVIPYFNRFIEQFPDLNSLAQADTQQVLRAWQGLGYYSRARNLQKAAQQIILEFAGRVPRTVDELITLPGIGRYTAGAVSSIAFEQRSPILDGNVARVLCRIDAIQGDPTQPDYRQKLWMRAAEILPARRIGDFNSALMELGALICTPRSPQCLLCPVRPHCQANVAGIQDKIPPPKPAKKTPLVERWTFCIQRDLQGELKFLLQQRPDTGRWAGMWQFTTLTPPERVDAPPSSAFILSQYKLRVSEPRILGLVEHALTHRRYRFHAFTCRCEQEIAGDWRTLTQMHELPMPKPHLRIRQMLEEKLEANLQ